MNTTDLPYEEQIEICDREIARLTQHREDLIMTQMRATAAPEAREAYDLTEDPTFAQYLATLGHDVSDRGAVMHALVQECSTREVTAFGYLCLASGVCRERFHALQGNYYRWRDGHLDGGMA
jgi:hypothetical protein